MSGSDTRLRVLEYLIIHMESNRSAPTREEIAAAIGLGPRSSVQYHIDTLVDDGYLERSTYRHRMIRPTKAGINVVAKLKPELEYLKTDEASN